MAYISWDEGYSVHHAGMDEQHAKIFEQISLLWTSSFKERRREVKEMLMQGLIKTIQQHFRDEEKLLETHHFLDLPHHRSLHSGLSRQLGEFDNKFNQSNYHNAPEMMEFLVKQVVLAHIMNEDRQYIPLFKNSSISLEKSPIFGNLAANLQARNGKNHTTSAS